MSFDPEAFKARFEKKAAPARAAPAKGGFDPGAFMARFEPAAAPPVELSKEEQFKARDPQRFAALERKRDELAAKRGVLLKEGLDQGITDERGAPVGDAAGLWNATKRTMGAVADTAVGAYKDPGGTLDAIGNALSPVAIKSAAASALDAAFPGGVRANLGGLMKDPFDFETPEMSAAREAAGGKIADGVEATAAAGPAGAQITGTALGMLSPLSVGGAAGRGGASVVDKVIKGAEKLSRKAPVVAPTLVNAAKAAVGAGSAASAEGAKGDVYMGKTPDVGRAVENFVLAGGATAAGGLLSHKVIGGATKKATSDMMADLKKSEKGFIAESKMKGIANSDDDYFQLIRKDKDLQGVPTMPADEALQIVRAKRAELSEPLTPAYDVLQGAKAPTGVKFAETPDDWNALLLARRAEIQESISKGSRKGTLADRDNLDELIADLKQRQIDPEHGLHAIRQMHGELSLDAILAQGKLMGTPAARKAKAMKQELRDIMHAELEKRAATSPEAKAAYAAIEKGNKPIALLSRLEDGLAFKADKEKNGITRNTITGMAVGGGMLLGTQQALSGNVGGAVGGLAVAGLAKGYQLASKGGRSLNMTLIAPLEAAIGKGNKWADVSSWAIPAGAAAGMSEAQTRGAFKKIQEAKPGPTGADAVASASGGAQ